MAITAGDITQTVNTGGHGGIMEIKTGILYAIMLCFIALTAVATDGTNCKACPPGFGVKTPCDLPHHDTVCVACPQGTFNDHVTSTGTCRPCQTCKGGYFEFFPCTTNKDTKCVSCAEAAGFGNEFFRKICEMSTKRTTLKTTVSPVSTSTTTEAPPGGRNDTISLPKNGMNTTTNYNSTGMDIDNDEDKNSTIDKEERKSSSKISKTPPMSSTQSKSSYIATTRASDHQARTAEINVGNFTFDGAHDKSYRTKRNTDPVTQSGKHETLPGFAKHTRQHNNTQTAIERGSDTDISTKLIKLISQPEMLQSNTVTPPDISERKNGTIKAIQEETIFDGSDGSGYIITGAGESEGGSKSSESESDESESDAIDGSGGESESNGSNSSSSESESRSDGEEEHTVTLYGSESGDGEASEIDTDLSSEGMTRTEKEEIREEKQNKTGTKDGESEDEDSDEDEEGEEEEEGEEAENEEENGETDQKDEEAKDQYVAQSVNKTKNEDDMDGITKNNILSGNMSIDIGAQMIDTKRTNDADSKGIWIAVIIAGGACLLLGMACRKIVGKKKKVPTATLR